MIKAGIIGATGYAGAELARLLLRHDKVELVGYGSRTYIGKEFADIYQNCFGLVGDVCRDDAIKELAKEADVIFTATPQGFCASSMREEILSQAKVIDLSADFRLKDPAVYEKWYGIEHKAKSYIEEAVYGLCEINREDIKKARLVANPGCYTTCSILSLYPMVKEGILDNSSIIIDAKSGTSGAGRGAVTDSLFCEVNENIKAYKVASHRHTPEIEEQLSYAAGESLTLSFTPHLIPMNRGILVTAYACLKKELSEEEIRKVYDAYYGKEAFVRILKKGNLPQTRWVKGSNYMDINFVLDERTNRIVLMAALDNLVKGAAGQAVQNMNLLFGLDEKEGLDLVPMFP